MKILFVAIMAVGGFIILVLVLNILDRDAFDGGTATPLPQMGMGEDPIAPGLVRETVSHMCPTCGECVHPVEILESRRTLTLVNHRPWYKLLGVGDQTLYYEDPVFLAACMQNRAARDPRGEWTITARVGPAKHPASGPHDCSELMNQSALTYELVTSEAAPLGAVGVFSYSYVSSRLPSTLHFGWQLRGKVDTRFPCSCGKP
jgi:hypothetical protein